jgi:hypothetical protein
MNAQVIQKYKQAIENSIKNANSKNTKLSEKVLNIDGMSTDKTRIFLNSLIETLSPKYFEIGVWKGSTFVSALYDNNPEYAVCLDNFSQFVPEKPGYQQHFGDPKNEFFNNIQLIKSKFDFYDADAFNFDQKNFKNKFNVYFYDGRHDHEDQKLALTYYLDSLEEDFIFICDDWNFSQVKTGTREGISENKIQIHEEWELPANYNGDKENWWNGLYIAILSKNKA